MQVPKNARWMPKAKAKTGTADKHHKANMYAKQPPSDVQHMAGMANAYALQTQDTSPLRHQEPQPQPKSSYTVHQPQIRDVRTVQPSTTPMCGIFLGRICG